MRPEQLIFAIIAFALFVYMFYKIIKNNDTSYIVLIILQAIGITLNFFEVIFKVKLNFVFMFMKYIIAIILPVIVIVLERNKMPFAEIVDITRANFWRRKGDNKKAKQALIHLISKYPENYQGHKNLAEIYEDEGGMRKSIDEYVQAIDIRKNDYDSYFKIAKLLTNLDKQDEAAQMLNNLLKKKPDYYEATVLLGDILISKELYKEAANIYQEGLRYNPVSYDLYYNLGMVYTMLNDFENAKNCYSKAAQINSLLYNAKYALAEIALIYKEIEEAQNYFMQVLENEELAPDAYYELAKIELIKGNKDTAIQYANTAIDSNAKKIVPKIKKEPIFIPIIARLTMPFNLEMATKVKDENDEESLEYENKEIYDSKGIDENTMRKIVAKRKLSQIEKKAKEHLEETFEITRNISYTDIEMLNRKQNYNNSRNKNDGENEIGKDWRYS